MLEFLTIAACVSGKGCNEITSAYYNYNVDLRQWSKRQETKIKSITGETNLAVLGTTTGLIFIKKGSFQLTNHINIVVGNETILQLHWETR